jgi:hypothetical protein
LMARTPSRVASARNSTALELSPVLTAFAANMFTRI